MIMIAKGREEERERTKGALHSWLRLLQYGAIRSSNCILGWFGWYCARSEHMNRSGATLSTLVPLKRYEE